MNQQDYSKLSPFEFKNVLIDLGKKTGKKLLDAGRGNPNFLNTTVRDGFSFFHHFVAKLSKQESNIPHVGKRFAKEGIAKKFNQFIDDCCPNDTKEFLRGLIRCAQNTFNLKPDDLIFEIADSILGDFYPVPPRILHHVEIVLRKFLTKILYHDSSEPTKDFDLFATEGATMAMVYIFNTLKINKLICPGDSIAIITPIFSPYLEIPELEEFKLHQIHIKCEEELLWQIPNNEIEKLKDPKIKALFLVNPSNPPGVSLSVDSRMKIKELVDTHRQDLIIISDDVYAPFVEDFTSTFFDLPRNTIGVYSYSKYYGVTGWRLGVISINRDNIFDKLMKDLPTNVKNKINQRYSSYCDKPEEIPFIERLSVDSREVALAHTGGLSCPQQIFMLFLSLFELMDTENTYKASIHNILRKRADILYESLGCELLHGCHYSYYYVMINLKILALKHFDKTFANYIEKEVSVIEFLLRLAKETATVCLPGEGFAGSPSTFRISLANLDDEEYAEIGKNIRIIIEQYYKEWQAKKTN